MERLIVIRKMTCRKKDDKSGCGYTEPTMGELQKINKGSQKGYHERDGGIVREQ